MTCFMPFNNRNLEISFFVFRPIVVLIDELMDSLKHFCLESEALGCAYSSILKSIHGNMIVWYGAWMKRSSEKKQLLNATLMSMLSEVSSMAIVLDHSFFDAYGGESKDGSTAARFSTGDTISMNATLITSDDLTDLSYPCLALFKSGFMKMDGVLSGVCFKCQNRQRVACLHVWNSLRSCYAWILNSDYRRTIQPYLHPLSLDVKYDVFRVVYVSSSEDPLNFRFYPHHGLMPDSGGVSSTAEGAGRENGRVFKD